MNNNTRRALKRRQQRRREREQRRSHADTLGGTESGASAVPSGAVCADCQTNPAIVSAEIGTAGRAEVLFSLCRDCAKTVQTKLQPMGIPAYRRTIERNLRQTS